MSADPPPEGGPPQSEPAPSAPELWRRGLELVGAFGPPVTVATALLVYFGWARTDAQARAMGLDASLFGYSVQDLVLRSIPSLYLPLVWLVILGIAWLWVDRLARTRIAADPSWGGPAAQRAGAWVRRVVLAVLPVGVVLAVALWIFVLVLPRLSVLYAPYAMAGAVLVAAWGLSLRRSVRAAWTGRWAPDAESTAKGARAAEGAPPPSAAPSGRRDAHAVEKILVFTLVSLLLFWGTSDYAQAVGRGLAVSIEQRLSALPVATVYSAKRLGLAAPGVGEQSLGTQEAPLFRYAGLRLLVVSGGRVFLLHDGWTLERGRVFVLPDDPSVRIEYGSPAAP